MTADDEPVPADVAEAEKRIPCENRAESGQVCGVCQPCITAQESDPRYRRQPDDTA